MKHLLFYLRWMGPLCLLWMTMGCEDYFGEKTNLDFIEVPEYSDREIAYVPIQPALTGFVEPVDLCIGYDQLFYVVDRATEEVVCLDESGRELARRFVQGARAVAQDRRFDLLVAGTKTDTVGGVVYDLACIYRLRLTGQGGYGLEAAESLPPIVHPFYFKSTFSSGDALVEFHDIAVSGDNGNAQLNNQFYVSRTGPSANNAGLGPDDAVLLFDNEGAFISPVLVTTSSGQFNDYFRGAAGLASLTQPPQISARSTRDFWFTSTDENNFFKVQYIEYSESEFGAEFRPQIFPPDTTLSSRALYDPNRFAEPLHLTYAGDGTNYLFVSDAARDSVYQFSGNGLEGVAPPPGSGEKKYALASFGGSGAGPTQFNRPMGLAYWNQILYVCDSGNGRILRFKLTLDFD
ncbi:hypothetical protein GC167_00105 [bacterium]|nr:hypothetical protein [bacterium]